MLGKPVFLTGRFFDIPLSFEEVAAVAALAPPEKKATRSTSTRKRGKQGNIVERARKYLAAVDPAISGQNGHDVTYRAACTLVVDFDLTMDEARPLLQEWNARCEPPWSDEELEHKLEDAYRSPGERGSLAESSDRFPLREITPFDGSLNTFEPMDSVVQEVIVLPSADDCPLVDIEDPLAALGFQFPEIDTGAELIVRKELPPLSTVPMYWDKPNSPEGRTDIANGKRLARIIDGKARYVVAWDSWIVWDGKRWRQDNLGIRELAKEIPTTILGDAMKEVPIDVNSCNWAILSASKAKIESAISMARSEPGISIDHQLLDSNPWLLNCLNGTVDLRTGEILPHEQANMITRLCSVNYDPNADTYDWDRFLESIFGSESLIGCVQRLLGYCATGSTQEQVLPIFWGSGSNGKTTLVETFMKVLGDDYASQAPKSLLIQSKSGDSHPTDLAMLHGKRFALGSESEDGQRLNEALVKQLTGSDKIVARRMREDFWTFTPTHKLGLMTNHKPRINGNDHGIWRRLVMIPFLQKFWNPAKGESGPEELRRDETLSARLHGCLPGVLAWIVAGSVEWHRNGLQLSPEVLAATKDYQSSQDIMGRFVEECCETSLPAIKVKFSRLYNCLEKWCDDSGENRPSRKAFGNWLVANGKERHPSNGETWYLGIEVRPDFDQKNEFESF